MLFWKNAENTVLNVIDANISQDIFGGVLRAHVVYVGDVVIGCVFSVIFWLNGNI